MSEPLKFTSENTFSIPKEQNHYGIPERDWNRLKELIQKIPTKINWFQTVYGICFGIVATAIFSLIGFDKAKITGWIIITSWCIVTTSSFLGIAFFIFDFKNKSDITKSKKDVTDEISRMEKAFEKC